MSCSPTTLAWCSVYPVQELMDCTTNFEWPTNKLRPEPPASLTELGGRSLAPGDVVDLYRLGHLFLGLVLQASSSCAMGGEAFDRYDIILDGERLHLCYWCNFMQRAEGVTAGSRLVKRFSLPCLHTPGVQGLDE